MAGRLCFLRADVQAFVKPKMGRPRKPKDTSGDAEPPKAKAKGAEPAPKKRKKKGVA